MLDVDHLWRALESGDARFDGWVYCGVLSTGIYCRPSCPAPTPRRKNVRFYLSAAAAQAAGLRACKRCRPDVVPGSPEWDRRADLVGRAMRLIADGVVDREGVGGLARRLGYSERHIHRELTAVVGAGPLALARSQRATTARSLLERTTLPIIDIAFAAGFQSVRQFNATIREVYAATPRQLRGRATLTPQPSGVITLRLPVRAPFDGDGLIDFLSVRAIEGVEAAGDGSYLRSLRLPHGQGTVELTAQPDHVRALLRLSDMRDLAAAVARCRALLDLDSDPLAVQQTLGSDPLIGDLAAVRPGVRVPGHVDGHELAFRALLGQQISVAGAARLAARIVATYGEELEHPIAGVTHLFPSASALAQADPNSWPMPRTRGRALARLALALAEEEISIDAGVERERTASQLLLLPGIGPWTVQYISMRALRDPDAFLPSDLGVRRALEHFGQDGSPKNAERISQRWRPYRAYALMHLWGAHVTAGRALSRAA